MLVGSIYRNGAGQAKRGKMSDISARIAQIVTPKELTGRVEVVYQTVAGLRWAIPGSTGDWYFTGDYPTPGGLGVLNQAYINYWEKREGRSY